MTSKQLVNHLCYEYNGVKTYNEERLKASQELKRGLEILEIIKKNPELVWWCCCYDSAYDMILDRKTYMIGYTLTEIVYQFTTIKKWLNQ